MRTSVFASVDSEGFAFNSTAYANLVIYILLIN